MNDTRRPVGSLVPAAWETVDTAVEEMRAEALAALRALD